MTKKGPGNIWNNLESWKSDGISRARIMAERIEESTRQKMRW